jgi:tetratricopeptide (TPR) repeat protein
MKKLFILALLPLMLVSCDDQLDIVPKGQSTLETVADLEMLLNQEYDLGQPSSSLCVLCNESYGYANNVAADLAAKKTCQYAWLAYDESVDRASLTTDDEFYSKAYKYISYMNTIIEKAPDASGDDATRTQIVAEAHVMRAYLHWLLVNVFAKQYDASTADTDGGIAYVTTYDIFADRPKETVAEVYQHILDDCTDEYINELPEKHADVTRGDQAWGNAVRAKVLMQMKDYSAALPYALKSLELNGTIEDRSSCVDAGDWVLPRTADDNLVYFGGMVAPFGEVVSKETANKFEAGDCVLYYAYLFGMKPSEGGDDDGDSDDEEIYDAKPHRVSAFQDDGFDASAMAWNSLYGSMTSGIEGSLIYYAMSSWVNVYGITSDRMYYTAAECYIRTGQIQKGLDLINEVRQKRIDPEHYTALTASTEQEAMAAMQPCKFIECIDTYENFFDRKRWNTESAYTATITRDLGDYGVYSIAPNSPLWIFPFPISATSKNASLTQNY